LTRRRGATFAQHSRGMSRFMSHGVGIAPRN
jgi:hypothetical protein